MAKKGFDVKGCLYAVGMALVVVGCFLPLVSTKIGNGPTAFGMITDGSGVTRISALLAFIGAAAGIALAFIKIRNRKMLKLVALVVSVLGGLYMAFSFLNQSQAVKGIAKFAAKATGATPGFGLILIFVGWILALLGFFFSKER